MQLPLRQCWLIIYLQCACAPLITITFSSKSLISAILDSCSLDLHLCNFHLSLPIPFINTGSSADIQLNSVLAFLCDRPIMDLQIAFSFLQPDKYCENLGQLKMLSRTWVCLFAECRGCDTCPCSLRSMRDLINTEWVIVGRFTDWYVVTLNFINLSMAHLSQWVY